MVSGASDLRIALLAAGVAIVAQLLDRALHRQPVGPLHPAIVIAFALVGWAALTVPLSYWPGGSVAELTDHFLKAVAFFWLIGTVVTTQHRLRLFVWVLVLCSIPLSIRRFSTTGPATSSSHLRRRARGSPASTTAGRAWRATPTTWR